MERKIASDKLQQELPLLKTQMRDMAIKHCQLRQKSIFSVTLSRYGLIDGSMVHFAKERPQIDLLKADHHHGYYQSDFSISRPDGNHGLRAALIEVRMFSGGRLKIVRPRFHVAARLGFAGSA